MATGTEAYSTIWQEYRTHRPQYPARLLQALEDYARGRRVTELSLLDVGCGTGILTEQLVKNARQFGPVVAIDQNAAMLAAARSALDRYDVSLIVADAEALPIRSESIDLIIAGQAAQWFERTAFFRECGRVLSGSGAICIAENNRDWRNSGFLYEYETFLENFGEDYSRNYREHDYPNELRASGFFDVRAHDFSWVRVFCADDFVGMALSSTKVHAIVKQLGKSEVEAAIRKLVHSHSSDGRTIAVPYVSQLYCGRKGT